MQIICANLLFYTLLGLDMHRFDSIQIDYP